MQQPIVSVLMTTYNPDFDYLKSALDSIYMQSYDYFEVILVDDGSELEVEKFILEQQYKNLKYIRLEKNQGITKALNIGLQYCTGKYIARMDDDDISLENRFKEQVAYLEKHSEIGVLGCNKKNFGENTNESNIRINKLSREQQQVELFFSNTGVPHPSVMLRKSFLDNYGIKYNENYKKSQDYGLWVECIQYTKICCLSEPLLRYRCHKKQISNMSGEEQQFYKNQVRLEQLKKLKISATEKEKKLHIDFCADNITLEQQKDMVRWIRKLYKSNTREKYFKTDIFEYRLFAKGYYNLRKCSSILKIVRVLYIFKLKFVCIYLSNKEKKK